MLRVITTVFLVVYQLILSILGPVFKLAKWLLKQVFGEVNWQAPTWLAWIAQKINLYLAHCKQNPKRASAWLAGCLITLVAAFFAWQWYANLPKPVLTQYTVTAPAVSTYDELGKPYPSDLIITFDASVAPVEAMNKPLTAGIQIKPNIAGEWAWLDDKTLAFKPKSDWPIDESFAVSMAKKKFFAPQVKLDSYDFSFKSAPFTVNVSSAEFYQDPVDANLKKLVSIIAFSHPVDEKSFKEAVNIKLGGGLSLLGIADEAQATINFDKHKLTAYVHSAPLSIPKEDTQLTLTLKNGIKANKGGNATADDVIKEVLIPGLYSLYFNDISMTLVDNERFEPEQVLVVGSSMKVSEAALKGHVSAWLLPEFNPKTPEVERKQPYDWYSDEVTKEILAQSEPLALKAQPSAETHDNVHSYQFKAPVGRKIYVLVDAGIQAFGGYMSQKPSTASITVKPYPQVVKLLSQGALLSLSGEKKLAYISRGLNGVNIEIGRILPKQLHHLVQRNHNQFAKPDIADYDLDALVERYSEQRPLASSEYGKPSYDSIDFGQYLEDNSEQKGGVFMVRVDAYDPENPEASSPIEADTRFILVTDIGIIAKKSVDGSQDVFVQSIATGAPITGAKVEVVGVNGIGAMTEYTDEQGHVHFEKLSELKREKAPLMYVVTKGDDLSFLPINRYDRNIDLSRFDIGGIDNAVSAQQLSAYGFTDRGIYRPGETAHIAMITRTANWSGTLAGLPLIAEITDPRGLPVHREEVHLDSTGLISLDYISRETSATGEYHVGLYVVKNSQRQEEIGSTSFKVRDFEPDRLKVNVTLADQAITGWIKPEQAQAKVKAMQLFGSPASDRRVVANMTLTPAIPAFNQYKEFSFQELYKLKESFSEQLPEAKTNTDGEAILEMNLKRFARATYRLYVSAKVFESGSGRGVNAESATLISSAPYLVGVKSDGNLNFIPRDANKSSEWIAISPTLKPIAVENLKQVWIERKFVSVLVKQQSGIYQYESRKKEMVRETKPINLSSKTNTIMLNTSEPGDFALALQDAQGNELNRIEYSVAGQANISRSLERNAELQLTLNKQDYLAGETIEVSVRAPYTGSGLITIERDRVYTHHWFKTTTTSSVQKITLPKDFEGNGYVSVQFVRDAASQEIFMSPLSYGVVPFEVNLDARRETVNVKLPSVIKPGQVLDMQVNTKNPSKVIVFAVDEGILQVARYQKPDPVGFFFQKRALQVNSSQILDLILPEFKQLMSAAAPGGDGDTALGRHLNPFKKKRQAPVAWWSGITSVDAKGQHFKYTVPETFNGKLRVFAVAVTPNKVGVFDGGTEIRGDLIVSPNVPAMVAPGDEFVVSVSVFNNIQGATGKTPVQLTLKHDAGISIVSSPSANLSISPQQESSAEFVLRANKTLGSNSLQFIAAHQEKRGKAIDAISVRPATPLSSLISVGQFKGDKEVIKLKRQLFNEHRDVKAGISSSPLVWAHSLNGFLDSYAYSCTEQLVSKGMPAMVLSASNDLASDMSGFEKVIQILRERQNGDGSFGLWSANMQVEPFASVYATHYLIEAKTRGLPVPADMLANANAWLEQQATGGSQGLSGVRTRAYAIYLLTKQGIVTSGMLATLQKELDERYAKEWQQDLTGAYMASSYKLLKQDALANKLMKNLPWLKGKQNSANAVYYDATVHDAQLIYLISQHFSERVASIPIDAINQLGQAMSDNQFHTLSAAYLILGFDAYASVAEANSAQLGIAEMHKDGKQTPLTLKGGAMKSSAVSNKAIQLVLSKKAQHPAFYALSETGFDISVPNKKRSDGLEIAKSYTTLDGKPLTKIKVGDEFLVKLSFRSTSADKVSQVAIVDLLPGGTEPVINATQESNTEAMSDAEMSEEGAYEAAPNWVSPIGEAGNQWLPEYADVREDRVILYGTLSRDMGTFVYRVRATNAGKFEAPAAFAEGMYNRQQQARGESITLEVLKP